MMMARKRGSGNWLILGGFQVIKGQFWSYPGKLAGFNDCCGQRCSQILTMSSETLKFMVPKRFISTESMQWPLGANGAPLGTIRPLELPGTPHQEPMEQGASRRSGARSRSFDWVQARQTHVPLCRFQFLLRFRPLDFGNIGKPKILVCTQRIFFNGLDYWGASPRILHRGDAFPRGGAHAGALDQELLGL